MRLSTLALLTCFAAHVSASAVDLNTVDSLLFADGVVTTGSRHRGVPQLQCLSNCHLAPSSIVCRNTGVDGNTGDPVWACKAQLPVGVELGRTDVSCEGFAHAQDRLVLRGSCALKYELVGSVHVARRVVATTATHPNEPFWSWVGLVFLVLLVLAACTSHPSYPYPIYAPPPVYGPRVVHVQSHVQSHAQPSVVYSSDVPEVRTSTSYARTSRRRSVSPIVHVQTTTTRRRSRGPTRRRTG